MSWKIKIGDKSILLDDLSENDLVEACQNHPDPNWLRLYTSPGSSPGALYDLINICALKLQIPAPERPATVKQSVRLLIDCVEQVDDDLPVEFGDEGVPLGEAADQETTTSSTSTELEDGDPT